MKISPKRNDKWLKKQFNTLNREYFDSVITCCKVRFGKTSDDADAHYSPEDNEIVISSDINGHDNVVFISLLHEMAHRKVWQEGYRGSIFSEDGFHGMRWHAEIDNLYKMGAYDDLL